ncbi:VWA domain-containing protein [Longispora sp. NPDC051575]|uniref:vWA domain-containing protein n=1 Tax=Longispora sp. NPDC051575 TaxID=3154943 RepID=UPI0034212353
MSEQILPFYVVCDESYSMEPYIDSLNQGLTELHKAIGVDAIVADKTRFCLIGFSGTADVLLPLSDLSEVTELNGLTAKSATSYARAFELVRDVIDRDVAALKRDGNLVYRPAVFFLSDGQPTDDTPWEPAYRRLVDQTWKFHPNIIAFGIGDADPDTIRRIGTLKSFMSDEGISPGLALHEFARALTKSIVRSGTALGNENEVTLQLPEKIPGFTEIRVEAI